MKSRPFVRRRAAALAASAALALSATSCADSSDGSEPDASTEETTSQSDSESQEESQSESSDGDADLPLDEMATVDGDLPMWALPVVSGWSVPAEISGGIFQITKDGSDTLVTTYQLKNDDPASDVGDEEGGRDWLDLYHAQIADNARASDVSEPTYSTTVLDTNTGTMEFVAQELQYSTDEGDRYTSFYAARAIEGHVFAVQYAALEDEWSQDEWDLLCERGLKLAF